MDFIKTVLIFGFIITLIMTVYFIIKYNSMQRTVQAIKEAQSNVIVFMKKRIELVNKLIDITKGYGDHEKLTYLFEGRNRRLTDVGGYNQITERLTNG